MATLVSLMVWMGNSGDGAFRLLGVLAVGTAAASILIPLFHVLSRGAVIEPEAGRDRPLRARKPEPWRAVAVTCPCCGFRDVRKLGRITCSRCGSIFELSVIAVSGSGEQL